MRVGVLIILLMITAITSCVKRQRVPRFEDYRVPLTFAGSAVAPDLSDPEARRFRTRLREASASGPNFADHFTLVTWGCGTECHVVAVIDAVTGIVTFVGGFEEGVEF